MKVSGSDGSILLKRVMYVENSGTPGCAYDNCDVVPTGIAVDSEDNVVVTCHTIVKQTIETASLNGVSFAGFANNQKLIAVIKFSKFGDHLWTRIVGKNIFLTTLLSPPLMLDAKDVVVDGDNNIFISSQAKPADQFGFSFRSLVTKLSAADGSTIWSRELITEANGPTFKVETRAQNLAVDEAGNVYLAAVASGSILLDGGESLDISAREPFRLRNIGDNDLILAKWDGDGTQVFVSRQGSTATPIAHPTPPKTTRPWALSINSQGSAIVVGETFVNLGGAPFQNGGFNGGQKGTHIFVAKFNIYPDEPVGFLFSDELVTNVGDTIVCTLNPPIDANHVRINFGKINVGQTVALDEVEIHSPSQLTMCHVDGSPGCVESSPSMCVCRSNYDGSECQYGPRSCGDNICHPSQTWKNGNDGFLCYTNDAGTTSCSCKDGFGGGTCLLQGGYCGDGLVNERNFVVPKTFENDVTNMDSHWKEQTGNGLPSSNNIDSTYWHNMGMNSDGSIIVALSVPSGTVTTSNVYVSRNSGASWAQVSLDKQWYPKDISMTDDGRIIYLTAQNEMFKSTNSGASFESLEVSTGSSLISSSLQSVRVSADGAKVIITSKTEAVYSIDSGTSWINIVPNYPKGNAVISGDGKVMGYVVPKHSNSAHGTSTGAVVICADTTVSNPSFVEHATVTSLMASYSSTSNFKLVISGDGKNLFLVRQGEVLYNHDYANGFAGDFAVASGWMAGTNGRMECNNDASVCLAPNQYANGGISLSTDRGVTWQKITDKGKLTTRSDDMFADVAVSGDGHVWGYLVIFGSVHVMNNVAMSEDGTKVGFLDRATRMTEECDNEIPSVMSNYTGSGCSPSCLWMSAASCDETHACDAGNTKTDGAGNMLCHDVDKTCVCKDGFYGNACGSS